MRGDGRGATSAQPPGGSPQAMCAQRASGESDEGGSATWCAMRTRGHSGRQTKRLSVHSLALFKFQQQLQRAPTGLAGLLRGLRARCRSLARDARGLGGHGARRVDDVRDARTVRAGPAGPDL
jgi:hypothetical protein